MYVMEIPCCDLNLLYQGNQAYRWIKVNEDKYIVITGDKITMVQQRKNKKAFLCSEEKFYDIWYNYFDINYDYGETMIEVKKFSRVANEKCFLTPYVLKQNRKLRILRSDLFETMIYYLLDDTYDFYSPILEKQRRKDPREDKIKDLCMAYGEKKHNTLEGMSINWYAFPKVEALDTSLYVESLTNEECSRIETLLEALCKDTNVLDRISELNEYDDVYGSLQKLYDDSNWIKSVMFYALGFKEAFALRRSNKKTFHDLQLTPKEFKQFDNIKGLLLEYLKVNENQSTWSRWRL